MTLIGWNIVSLSDAKVVKKLTDQEAPTYQTQNAVTVAYNTIGSPCYKLLAADLKYYNTSKLSQFAGPAVTLFDEEGRAIWIIQSDLGKITKNKMLYLDGHVEINNLNPSFELKKITTKSIRVNLITQDIFSDTEVMIYGTTFTSSGMKIQGNLRNKTAELIDKVKTIYAIYN